MRLATATRNLVDDEVEEIGREVVALATHDVAELASVDRAAVVRVEVVELVELGVQVAEQARELAERDLIVTIGVVFLYERLDRVRIELGRWLTATQRFVQLLTCDTAVAVRVDVAEEFL